MIFVWRILCKHTSHTAPTPIHITSHQPTCMQLNHHAVDQLAKLPLVNCSMSWRSETNPRNSVLQLHPLMPGIDTRSISHPTSYAECITVQWCCQTVWLVHVTKIEYSMSIHWCPHAYIMESCDSCYGITWCQEIWREKQSSNMSTNMNQQTLQRPSCTRQPLPEFLCLVTSSRLLCHAVCVLYHVYVSNRRALSHTASLGTRPS